MNVKGGSGGQPTSLKKKKKFIYGEVAVFPP
jgi:hypothetical protein